MFTTSYLAGGRLDPPFYPTKTKPFVPGFIMDSASFTTEEFKYTLPADMEFYAISVSCSVYELDDKWDLLVNGEYFCKNIYTKKLPEGMHFMVYEQLTAGDEIIFRFYNQGIIDKTVWFELHCLK
ncbi:Low copy number virion structural protein [Bacillus cytotoxicus]|uniref:Low copy number virion structural protein n=1 Tax=Bacillus cytotoxicus TaxID=580165 RepID=A0AAX2CNP3_9BACI|nr:MULTISPECIES: Low copy number virion structural protein [Bacillus cereus group]QTR81241.1 Low copy number virion structural protein [Bacillus cytotoxicus]QTR83148.1 Low copy number virion structural protein [Bacillus cytotoxicus]QTR86885.1 Low copy number virion structural protein [Bacillus cytotoxicus]SCM08317.1 Low copy number virion structural protein [Bacillus cytotoxicus]